MPIFNPLLKLPNLININQLNNKITPDLEIASTSLLQTQQLQKNNFQFQQQANNVLDKNLLLNSLQSFIIFFM